MARPYRRVSDLPHAIAYARESEISAVAGGFGMRTEVTGYIDAIHHLAVQCPVKSIGIVGQIQAPAPGAEKGLYFCCRAIDAAHKLQAGRADEYLSAIDHLLVQISAFIVAQMRGATRCIAVFRVGIKVLGYKAAH